MEKHPHEKVLDKIAELMQFAYDNANKPVSQEKLAAVEAQLKELDNQVEEFKKISEKILEGSGLTDYLYEAMKTDAKNGILSEEEKKMLERGDFLKKEALAASKDLVKAAVSAQQEGTDLSGKQREKKAKSPKSRKGKFRSMGGTKWKPM